MAQDPIRLQKLVAHNANEVQACFKDLDSWTSEMQVKEETDQRKAKALELKDEGNQHMKDKSYHEAIKKYTEALTLDPKNAVLYSNRAQAHLFLQQYMQAVNDCAEALKLEPANEKAAFRRAKAYVELDQLAPAKQDLLVVLKQSPKNGPARQLFEQVNTRLKQQMPLKRHQEMISSYPLNVSARIHDERGGGDVEIYPKKIFAIEKPAHLRSKRVILTVPVKIKGGGLASKRNSLSSSSSRMSSLASPMTPSEEKPMVDAARLATEIENMTTMEVPPKPTTAAQFTRTWKLIKDYPAICAQYLNQLQSNDYSIFQDSMDLTMLSDILTTLQWEFLPRKWPFTHHLEGLLRVKRITTLFMLMTEKDRAHVRNLLSNCNNIELQKFYSSYL